MAAHLSLQREAATLRTIEIVATPSGAPEVFVSGKLLDIAISITHSGDTAACALSGSGTALGCDIEQIEPRSNSFLEDYFTVEEQSLLRRSNPTDQWRLAALLWSAKESTLKALRVGLRLDTRCVRVTLEPQETQRFKEREWSPL
ncbi:MAG: 4'-phosphopantetheinyl transferase superfamily protein, partial [Acidobacteria bacterium]|nr:4'-phosphopantetheinyl transferase superfamily protein [Acidobacteriota bacterium]